MTTAKPKKPFVAALLNAWPLPIGLGYLYLGNWPRFLFILVLGYFAAPFLFAYLGLRQISPYFLLALWLGSIIDAYNQAQ